jgi:hypothetical protein
MSGRLPWFAAKGDSNGTLSLAGKYYNIFYDLLPIVYCALQFRVVTYVQE